MEDTEAPYYTYEAADWLRSRHPWLDELVTRVCGTAEQNPGWVDEITDAFNDLSADSRAWADYERAHPAPSGDAAYDEWVAAGPRLQSPAAQAIAPMSSGEVRMLRLVTTLGTGDRCVQGWRVDDLAFDERGRAVVEDWVRVVFRQFG